VLAGVLTMMVLIGLLFALLSLSFANILPILLPLIYLVVIGMGVLLIAGKNPFAQLQSAQAPLFKNPYLSAFVYGLLLAPMTLPCTGPLLVGAFAFSAGIGDIADGLLYFLFFGLGFGWPLVVLPLLAIPLQRRLVGWLAQHHDHLSRASGVLLLAVGLFGIITELLPQFLPEFSFDTTLQLGYWAAALGIVALIFWHLQRPTTKPD
jgi:cytochrome c-type biogenesis protein